MADAEYDGSTQEGPFSMDSPLSLNAMRALQSPITPQNNGTQKADAGSPKMDGSQMGSQIFNAAMAFLKNLAAGTKDGKNEMSPGDKDQSKLAINGVQGGRLNQERGSMA